MYIHIRDPADKYKCVIHKTENKIKTDNKVNYKRDLQNNKSTVVFMHETKKTAVFKVFTLFNTRTKQMTQAKVHNIQKQNEWCINKQIFECYNIL